MDRNNVKKNLNKDVIYNGTEYLLTACIFRLKADGSLYCQAEIKDKSANSILICRLEDIEEKQT